MADGTDEGRNETEIDPVNLFNKVLYSPIAATWGIQTGVLNLNIKDTYFRKDEMPQIEQAVTGAENVNATITEGNIFEVTDRTGATKTLDLNVTGGTSAGFGEIAATVDNSTGTPSVIVTTSGTNEAKNFTFAFTGLKGENTNIEPISDDYINALD